MKLAILTLIVLAVLAYLGSPIVSILLANPLWILIIFIVLFLLVPMLKVIFDK